MARLPRLYIPDQPQHVILRVRHECQVLVDDQDRDALLYGLQEAAGKADTGIHAWVLLPHVIHLVVTPASESALSFIMKETGRHYVRRFNRRHGRRGPFWAGTVLSTVIEPERYLLMACQFVEFTPVQARLARTPEDYLWSSYGHNAGLCVDEMVTEHALYGALGNTPFARHRVWQLRLERAPAQREINALMEATNKGWVLGGPEYQVWAAANANRRPTRLSPGRPRKVTNIHVDPANAPTLPDSKQTP